MAYLCDHDTVGCFIYNFFVHRPGAALPGVFFSLVERVFFFALSLVAAASSSDLRCWPRLATGTNSPDSAAHAYFSPLGSVTMRDYRWPREQF